MPTIKNTATKILNVLRRLGGWYVGLAEKNWGLFVIWMVYTIFCNLFFFLSQFHFSNIIIALISLPFIFIRPFDKTTYSKFLLIFMGAPILVFLAFITSVYIFAHVINLFFSNSFGLFFSNFIGFFFGTIYTVWIGIKYSFIWFMNLSINTVGIYNISQLKHITNVIADSFTPIILSFCLTFLVILFKKIVHKLFP